MKEKLFYLQLMVYYYNTEIILFLKRDNRDNILMQLLFVIFIPYFILHFLFRYFIEKTLISFVEKKKQKESKLVFENEIAIVAIIKNEAPYLKEWIDYHILKGFRKFYIYDNEDSTVQYSTVQYSLT